MADMEEVLERQERETRERMRRRAASKRAQRELDEQLGIAVALLESIGCYFVPDLGPELGPISPSGLLVLVAPTLARAGPLLLDVVF
ncbi:hypothetical protein L3X38_028646 [Prunus dulcis]|uniref:Uncharacterized protein n=1 Tax=Prunus dulcis TaxID=3755 RepID=A0AAD4VQ51_PRUDU|nr:hypothetical protein L3X38_028646 [Prunus dulcis]